MMDSEDRKYYHYETSRTGNYPLLKVMARQNRRVPTEAESILWHLIRKGELGFRFRRQHPIGNYIVDFVCLKAQLVVEVDGGYHKDDAVKMEDELRERCLEREGYTILRFTNEEVICQPECVVQQIKEKLYDGK